MVNVQKAITIDPAVSLATAAVGGVGQVLAQPGAAPLLGAGLTAMGIPGAGLIASAIPTASNTPAPAAPPPSVVYAEAAKKSDDGSNSLWIMIGGGVLVLGLILTLVLSRRGKK